MKSYFLFLADGFEISEALTTVDMLRRGGIPVKTVSIKDSDRTVTSSNGIPVIADIDWKEFLSVYSDEFDSTVGETECTATGSCIAESALPSGNHAEEGLMVFPGGMPGSTNLAAKEELMRLMTEHFAKGGVTAAICAAPSVVLSKLPGIAGRLMCCYEGFEKALEDAGARVCKNAGVVSDGNLITARGAGFAMEFGLAIVAALKGQETADRVAAEIMLPA